MAHVLFVLFVFACVQWCSTYIVLYFYFVFLRLVYPMLPVSLDCPFLMTFSVLSNVYLIWWIAFYAIHLWMITDNIHSSKLSPNRTFLEVFTGFVPSCFYINYRRCTCLSTHSIGLFVSCMFIAHGYQKPKPLPWIF